MHVANYSLAGKPKFMSNCVVYDNGLGIGKVRKEVVSCLKGCPELFFNLLAPELFFLILAHSVYKM